MGKVTKQADARYEPCGACGGRTKFRDESGKALCRICAIKDRKCLRCQKPLPRASYIVKEGALCWPCSVYYREPRGCPVCGQLSLRLARDRKRGIDQPVCERCRSKGMINCKVCGKHRRPAGTLSDGKIVCRRCLERGENPFICSSCGQEGKQHSKTICITCYFKKLASKRFRSALTMLTHHWVKDAFKGFYEELIEHQNPNKVASASLERYFIFFAKLDATFQDPSKITATGIMDAFGQEGLRVQAIPYGYLVKTKIIPEIQQEELESAGQRQRQNAMMEEIRGCWYESLMERFRSHLDLVRNRYEERGWRGKKARFTQRTVTSGLMAAKNFLKHLDAVQGVRSVQGIQQHHLEQFLLAHNGYAASIGAFVRYINRYEKTFKKIKIETVTRNLSEGGFIPTARYEELLRGWLNPEAGKIKESLICLMMILYAQPARKIVRFQLSDLSLGRDGQYRLLFGQTEISLDSRISALFGRYMSERTALATLETTDHNEYLFPGQKYGSHLSEATVSQYLKTYGVTARSMFSTALYNAYVHNLAHPKVLVKAFGISDKTAIKYFNLLDHQLIQAVNAQVLAHG